MSNNKIKVNDTVSWKSEPKDGSKPYEAKGTVISFKDMRAGGGKMMKLGAYIDVRKGTKYHKLTGRTRTLVSLERLTKV